METLLNSPGKVLDENGEIIAGYSTRAIKDYHRKDIKAPFYRIKEWDFYQISNNELCLQLTFGHASYAGQMTAMLFNFITGEVIANTGKILVFPFGKLHLPESAKADSNIEYKNGKFSLKFKTTGDIRYLSFTAPQFEAQVTLECKTPESIIVNIPFDEYKTAFYYNHKINCMTARGKVNVSGKEYVFDSGSYGLLDWGRGVWPFHNEWYWSNGTGLVDGELFGFNLGCGFGNTSKATENILFYGGKSHKLGAVHFALGKNYMDNWRLYDDEGRIDITLTPTYDRTTKMKVLFVDNCTHQMFGAFNGKAILDDGAVLKIENIYAFAEHAVNNW